MGCAAKTMTLGEHTSKLAGLVLGEARATRTRRESGLCAEETRSFDVLGIRLRGGHPVSCAYVSVTITTSVQVSLFPTGNERKEGISTLSVKL